MFVAIKLKKQRCNVASHVTVGLVGKFLPVRAVEMRDHGTWVIAALIAFGEQTIPQFGILAASGSSGAQPLVEQTYSIECLAPEGHVGAGSHAPDGHAEVHGVAKKV